MVVPELWLVVLVWETVEFAATVLFPFENNGFFAGVLGEGVLDELVEFETTVTFVWFATLLPFPDADEVGWEVVFEVWLVFGVPLV